MRSEQADVLVIGGGFFGASLAMMLVERGLSVVVVEREEKLLQRASFNNQARVHAGYHYPRSLMTAFRSSYNFPRFCQEYADCLFTAFESYYFVARKNSKVTARQFETMMGRTGSPLFSPSARVASLVDNDLVERLWRVTELAFDADKLTSIVEANFLGSGVRVLRGLDVAALRQAAGGFTAAGRFSDGDTFSGNFRWVFNCTYSGLNRFQAGLGLPLIPLKHELTEMPLVEVPSELEGVAFTAMCGPFFSLMPFPARGLCTLSHVRYTPHFHWSDGGPGRIPSLGELGNRPSNFPYMVRDAARFVPAISKCRQHGSVWEVKTTLPQSELDDGRPILFSRDLRAPTLVHVLGGKIDNIYDLPSELNNLEFWG